MFQGSCEVALTLVTERGSARHPIRLGRTQCSVSTPSTRAQKFSTLRLRDARQSSRNPAPTASPRSHTLARLQTISPNLFLPPCLTGGRL